MGYAHHVEQIVNNNTVSEETVNSSLVLVAYWR